LSFYFQSDKELFFQIRQAIESKQSFIIERLKLYENDINHAFENTEFLGTSIHLYHRKEYEIYTLTNKLKNPDKLPDFVTCIVSVPVNESNELRKATSKIIQQFGHSNVSNYQEGKKVLGEFEFNTIQIRVKKPNLDSLDITIMTGRDHDILDNFVKIPIKEKRIKKKVVGISAEHLELWSDWMEYIILEKGENAIKDIWDSLDKNLFEDRIVCFSVDQKAIHLPQGSTVLDFAFALSKETGLNFNGAKIQEQVFDIHYKLSGNETIQILKSKKVNAIPDWRNYISDYRALGYFYHYLRSKNLLSAEFSNELIEPSTATDAKVQSMIDNLARGFFGKILIKGNDRKHLLNDITKAIGDSEIRKSTIQGSDSSNQFEGVFDVFFQNANSYNRVILQLLNIRNVKSAELINFWSN
jgi:GTP pyrophosphokinase